MVGDDVEIFAMVKSARRSDDVMVMVPFARGRADVVTVAFTRWQVYAIVGTVLAV